MIDVYGRKTPAMQLVYDYKKSIVSQKVIVWR